PWIREERAAVAAVGRRRVRRPSLLLCLWRGPWPGRPARRSATGGSSHTDRDDPVSALATRAGGGAARRLSVFHAGGAGPSVHLPRIRGGTLRRTRDDRRR